MKKVVVRAQCGLSGEYGLSVLDVSCAGMVIRGTWLFRGKLDEKLLRDGLGQILDMYPQLGGRIDGMKRIRFDNSGVSFAVDDEPRLNVAAVAAMPKAAVRFGAGMNMRRVRAGKAPLLSVRVTYLADGTVLSVWAAHVVMDGAAFYGMVDNWGCLCRGIRPQKPSLDNTLFDAVGRMSRADVERTIAQAGWSHLGIGQLVDAVVGRITGTLMRRAKSVELPLAVLERFRDAFAARHGRSFGMHTLLSALTVKACFMALHHADDIKCQLVTTVDMRGRTGGVTSAFSGNAVCNVMVEFHAGDTLYDIAEKENVMLSRLFGNGGEELARYAALYFNAVYYKLPMLVFDLAGMTAKRPTTLYINDFMKFPLYNVDFGEGELVAVLPHDLPDQIRFWPMPSDGPGVEVLFTGSLGKIMDAAGARKMFAMVLRGSGVEF